MSWRESVEPARMRRVAILAPRESLRDVLVEVAGRGVAELDVSGDTDLGPAGRLLQRSPSAEGSTPLLSRTVLDLEDAARAGRTDLLAGEAQLEMRAGAGVFRGLVAGTVAWMAADEVAATAGAVAQYGGAIVPIPSPPGFDPPTLVHSTGRLNRSFAPLMDTYATIPYADVDPTALAGLAFVVMFGMMFADAGQGTLLVLLGLMLRAGRPGRLARFRPAWPFLVGAGITAVFFGILFGEFFGPTGVLPVLWIEPLEEPILLLEVAIGIGACLLAGAYVLGTVNRWREGGWRLALVSSSGLAGVAVFLGLGLLALGAYVGSSPLMAAAGVVCVGGLALSPGPFAGQHARGVGGALLPRLRQDRVGLGPRLRQGGGGICARVGPHGVRIMARSIEERGRQRREGIGRVRTLKRGHGGITTVSGPARSRPSTSPARVVRMTTSTSGGRSDQLARIWVSSSAGSTRTPTRARPWMRTDSPMAAMRPMSGVSDQDDGDDEAVDGDALGEADDDHGAAEELGALAHRRQRRRAGVGHGDGRADGRPGNGDGGAKEGSPVGRRLRDGLLRGDRRRLRGDRIGRRRQHEDAEGEGQQDGVKPEEHPQCGPGSGAEYHSRGQRDDEQDGEADQPCGHGARSEVVGTNQGRNGRPSDTKTRENSS